jgi:hypothetical protein
MKLQVTYVKVKEVTKTVENLKKGDRNTRGGPPNQFEMIHDVYTSVEDGLYEETYWLSASDTIDHVIMIEADTLSLPFEGWNLAFAWQRCGNGRIFPPVPNLMGTIFDGTDIWIEKPAKNGIYEITVGIAGFDEGTWDYVVMVDHHGRGPINPNDPSTDTFGGSRVTFALYDSPADVIGEGPSCARPWCFEVTD